MYKRQLPFVHRGEVTQEDPNTLAVITHPDGFEKSDVRVSFFGGLRFGRTGTPERTKDGVLDVASLDDLMATEVVVILNRVECKDYRDIAAMISAGEMCIRDSPFASDGRQGRVGQSVASGFDDSQFNL